MGKLRVKIADLCLEGIPEEQTFDKPPTQGAWIVVVVKRVFTFTLYILRSLLPPGGWELDVQTG